MAAPIIRLKHFHVTNLDVNVSEDDLCSYLKTFAPNVTVGKFTSRNLPRSVVNGDSVGSSKCYHSFSLSACFMLHINVQSITNKINQLNIFLSKIIYDILCVSEHGLNQGKLNLIKLNNYNLISAYCRSHIAHWAVAIFATNKFKLKSVDVNEFCSAEIVNRLGKCVLASVHRSSSHGNIAIFKEKILF